MKVLIADDSAVVRTRLAEMLKMIAGVRAVDQAESARGAVAAITNLKPDIVVLDVQLGDGTGMDVLMAIRGRMLEPKVIMLTNYPYPMYQDRCLKLGAHHFFDKSTEFNKAIALVAQWTEESRAPLGRVKDDEPEI
jgi:DNA-binding NarL/FixJ family response regulator